MTSESYLHECHVYSEELDNGFMVEEREWTSESLGEDALPTELDIILSVFFLVSSREALLPVYHLTGTVCERYAYHPWGYPFLS